MAGPRPMEGDRALLFERLVDLEPGLREARPFVLHDRNGLKQSVAGELERLFSTRAPVAADILETRQRSTIDYGIPDLSLFNSRDGGSRGLLARHMTQAIESYEPRLGQPRVTLHQTDVRPDMLIAEVTGMLMAGQILEPVSFTIPLGGHDG